MKSRIPAGNKIEISWRSLVIELSGPTDPQRYIYGIEEEISSNGSIEASRRITAWLTCRFLSSTLLLPELFAPLNDKNKAFSRFVSWGRSKKVPAGLVNKN